MTRRQHLVMAGLVLVAALWEFAPAARAGFVHQDNRWQTDYGVTSPAPSWSHPFTSRPLMRWSWWLQSSYTPSALAFHAVNLALHVLASVLVAVLAWRLGASALGIWVAGVVFLLNPIHTEASIYLSGRPELFAAMGVVSACILLCGRVTWPRLVGAALAAAFGLAGKESAVILLAVVPIVRRRWLTALPALVALAVVVWSVAWTRSYASTWDWALLNIAVAWRLFATTITLAGHTVDYDPLIAPADQWMSLILLLVSVCCGWTWRRRAPLATIGTLWIVAVIIPRLCVMTGGTSSELLTVFTERWFYSALVGFALIAASVVSPIGKKDWWSYV